MDLATIEQVARLIRKRNRIDAEIAAITRRPVVAGHLGEWIASNLFDITLEESATARGFDGRFASGPLRGSTVNVKWYSRREGTLDMTEDPSADYYLVLTGPRGQSGSSRGATRPLSIVAVYLFDAPGLLREARSRAIKIGAATSVLASHWQAAEVFPVQRQAALPLNDEQRRALSTLSDVPDAA